VPTTNCVAMCATVCIAEYIAKCVEEFVAVFFSRDGCPFFLDGRVYFVTCKCVTVCCIVLQFVVLCCSGLLWLSYSGELEVVAVQLCLW